MKNKHMFTPPPKIFIVTLISAVVLASTSCSANSANRVESQNSESVLSSGNQDAISASEQETNSSSNQTLSGSSASGDETSVPITSGPLYEMVVRVNPELSVSETDGCFHISMDFKNGTAKEGIRRFFWDIVQLIQVNEIWDAYSSMSCVFLNGSDVANVNISQYESLFSFSTAKINIMQDAEVASLFDQFYYAVFGARDASAAQEKSLYDLSQQTGAGEYDLPENYQTGYLWVYSSFGSGCGYTIDGNEISVQVVAENSAQGGGTAAQELLAATDAFNQFFNNDSVAMPYTKIAVQYIDPSGNITLWDWCSEKNGDSWSVTKNSSSNEEFASGIKSAASKQE